MATISNNEIKIKYSLDTTDLANATALFDRLSAEDRQLLNDLKKLQAQLNATGQAGQQAGNQIGNGMNNARSKTKGVLDDLIQFQNPLKQIAFLVVSAFSVQSIVRFGKTVLDTTIKMESLRKAIEFTSGSVTAGLVNFQFLTRVAEELGLPLEAAAEGFKGFSAAAGRANISMEQQQVMFTDLSKAMAALQVTSQDAQLIFFGFSQLMSKSKVSAQELYHQISERLPLAMEAAQIAAGRMTGEVKVTTGELMKMVESGKLLSEKFAPEFTKALGELAGDAAYVETLGKSFTRLGNSWKDMLDSMGQANKGWFKDTIDGFRNVFDSIKDYFKGFQKSIDFEQTVSFENAIRKSEKMTTESIEFRLMILEKQKQVAQKEVDAIQKTFDAMEEQRTMITIDGQDFLGVTPDGYKETKKNLEEAQLKLANLTGTVDAFNQTLQKRKEPIIKQDDLDGIEKAQKLYKILIDRQEALKKAEEDKIKAATRPGYERDIQLLQNNVKFNEEMLKIDEDRRFKDLELAKNNAVKRKAENIKDRQEELNIIKKANDEALQYERDYLDKTNEELKKAQDERRKEIQTDQQNELDDSAKFQKEKYDQAVAGANKALAVQALDPKTRERIMKTLQDQLTKIEQEGEADRDAIREKYRLKMIQEAKEAQFEYDKLLNEANTIRKLALTTNEVERLKIVRDGALEEISIKKEAIKEQMLDTITNSQMQIEERANTNKVLLGQLMLLQAQEVELTRDYQQQIQDLRAQNLQNYLQHFQAVMTQAFALYANRLNNEMVLMNKRFDKQIELADGNEQKIQEINEKRAQKEKEYRARQFQAEKAQAIANILFAAGPQIVKNALIPPLAAVIAFTTAAQIGLIMAQQVPEFAEGTKGKKFKGGPAIVGERGVEKVITESGKVYYTPDHASLVELPKGSQVIPNHALSQKELFWANALNNGKPIPTGGGLERKLDEIGGILRELPIHQINMDERGFEKYIRTPRRSTRILNNRFGINN